jgi:hypothetical protein
MIALGPERVDDIADEAGLEARREIIRKRHLGSQG